MSIKMSVISVKVENNRLILPQLKEVKIDKQESGIRLHLRGAGFFKFFNLAYDVTIDNLTYTVNAESYRKWRLRIKKNLLSHEEVNTKTIEAFIKACFEPKPALSSQYHLHSPTRYPSKSNPSLSPSHIADDPNAYKPGLFGPSTVKANQADVYAKLRKEKEKQEKEAVQNALQARKKAKEEGRLTHILPKKKLSEAERQEAQAFVRLISSSY